MAMKSKELQPYICRIVGDYLTDRTFYFQVPNGTVMTINPTNRVPQGSVFGPTLWNIIYDELLSLRLLAELSGLCGRHVI